MRILACSLVALLAVAPVTAAATQGPPDGSTPEQRAAIDRDPLFRSRSLQLTEAPAAGRPHSLFNGRDLSGWDTWLGYRQPMSTYGAPSGAPIGLNHDATGVFSVVMEDGQPAILANGKLFGGLITRKSYRNYHLHLQYKWGPHTWTPMPRNNGILYHSHGRYGAFFGTWMTAVEFEIVPHSVGMVLTVGDSHGKPGFETVEWKVGAAVEVGSDPSIAYPRRRFMPGGRLAPVVFPAFNVEAAVDAERPIGEWNTLDLYVYGDQAVHVVNGTPVMVVHNITTTDAAGKRRPLSSGRIQLQSEGAETYFRDISIQPLRGIPKVHAS